MNENISPFVKSHKPWIIRKTIADYLRAKNMFGNLDMETSSDQAASFAKLKKLSDLLFTIKEDLHLVFKRVIDPQNSMYEKSDKYEPNKDETELINNIGLLFHKIMVTRELVYVMEHYATDSEDYTQSKFSFDLYWSKIHYLFEEGVDLIKRVLKDCKDNIIVISYLVENDQYVKKTLGESVYDLLETIEGNDKIDTAFYRVGKFCMENGWQERARRALSEAIRINPENKKAKRLFQQAS